MESLKRNGKKVAIDIAGFTLLGLAPFLGPLPGPGGIPLILAGLGLLSINHAWAKNARQYLIKSGNSFAEFLFPEKPVIQMAYDIFAIMLFGTVYLMLNASQAYLTYTISGMVAVAAITMLLINRKRAKRLNTWLTARFKKS